MTETQTEDKQERHRASARAYYAKNAETMRERVLAANRASQEETLKSAEKKMQPWTEAEDQELLSSPLTNKELALKLGRTFGAVGVRRSRLRKEQQQQLADAATNEEEM